MISFRIYKFFYEVSTMYWSNVFRYFFNIIQTLSFFHVPFWSDCEMFIVSCSTLRENHAVAPKTVWLPANMPRNIRSDSKKSLNVEQRRCSETNKSQERGISGKTRQTSLRTKTSFVFYSILTLIHSTGQHYCFASTGGSGHKNRTRKSKTKKWLKK